MRKNKRDHCTDKECDKSIKIEPNHFRGVPADHGTMLRCVLYEMYVLAISIEAIERDDWPEILRDRHKTLGEFGPQEALQVTALVKFRTLFDFFYSKRSGDDFTADDFDRFGVQRLDAPEFDGFANDQEFTRESVNKFVAHLTWARINKPKCVLQARFSGGRRAVVSNGLSLLEDADRFVATLVSHPSFPKLATDAEGYLEIFRASLHRLQKLTQENGEN